MSGRGPDMAGPGGGDVAGEQVSGARHDASMADRLPELEKLLASRSRELAALAEANRSLAETIRVKDDFLALLSHELRTPLTGILLWADILGGDPEVAGHESAAEGLAVITRAAERMLDTVEGLLDLGRIESGRLRLERLPADPVALAVRMVDQFRSRADEAGHVLVEELAGSPPSIPMDAARIQQVLRQLLSNAIKFTEPPGRIIVRVGVAPDGAAAVVEVADSGPGIPDEVLARVFEDFPRPPGQRRPGAGLGIGLALSRALVEAHGGRFHLESRAGVGTTVRLELPTQPPDPSAAPGETRRSARDPYQQPPSGP